MATPKLFRIIDHVEPQHLDSIVDTHPKLRAIADSLVHEYGMERGRAKGMVKKMLIAVLDDFGDTYSAEMMARLDRIGNLRDKIVDIYDAVAEGKVPDIQRTHVEDLFRELAEEMEALRSPSEFAKKHPGLAQQDIDSRILHKKSEESQEPVTAQPKSEPAPPEGFGDILEYSDIEARDKLIGGTLDPGRERAKRERSRQRKERGIDVHEYQDPLDQWARDRLRAGDPSISGRLFPDQRRTADGTLVPNERPAATCEFEFVVIDPRTGKAYRMDAVDFERRIIYEIKSDHPDQVELGQNKLDNVYKPLMDQEYSRSDFPEGWEVRVVVYDRAVAEQLLYGR
jgi:hypothetical protein